MIRRELFDLKKRAVNYRKLGYSYGLINKKLGISKSTLSNWLRDIRYKQNKQVVKRIKEAFKKSASSRKLARLQRVIFAKALAKEELGIISKRDLWMIGIGLYLGKGSKNSKNGIIRIVNSNPKIIKIAITWFKNICGVPNQNLKISVHAYMDNNIENTINYWSTLTGIPKNQFGKTQIDKRKNKSTDNIGKLPWGTAHLTILANGNKEHGIKLFRRIISWTEVIEEQINAGMV